MRKRKDFVKRTFITKMAWSCGSRGSRGKGFLRPCLVFLTGGACCSSSVRWRRAIRKEGTARSPIRKVGALACNKEGSPIRKVGALACNKEGEHGSLSNKEGEHSRDWWCGEVRCAVWCSDATCWGWLLRAWRSAQDWWCGEVRCAVWCSDATCWGWLLRAWRSAQDTSAQDTSCSC
jgi:hypothetical protein